MPTGSSDLASDPLLATVPLHRGYRVLGGVVLYQKLGQGGMGVVYRGRHVRLDVDVALKVMSLPSDIPPAERKNFIQRFLREARTAASVRHPNLIRVADVNSECGLYFLTMDLIDGESAADRAQRKGKLSEAEVVEICLGAAEGLAEAHSQGIVHRDVKPDNIMIDKKGRVTVTDLGLAKAYGEREGEGAPSFHISITQQAIGTPFYMSPEQTRCSKDVGPASDVWSLGVTLYELATGEPPWTDTDVHDLIQRIRTQPQPDVGDLRADLSGGFRAVVGKALSKTPEDRYAHCGDLSDALREHLDSIGTSGTSVLADTDAGAARGVLQGDPPPPPATMVLIGRSLEDAGPSSAQAQAAAGWEADTVTVPPPGTTPPTVPPGQRETADEFDDRAVFGLARAVISTVADLDPELADEDAAWEAFLAWTGRDRREYEAVRRTAHSLFYYQAQDLYEFGIERLGRDDLPLIAGRAFASTVYEENLAQLLQIALADDRPFPEAITEVLASYLFRCTGNRFVLESEAQADQMVFTLRSSNPEAGVRYCQQHGIDPARALRHSFFCVAGGLEEVAARIVADFEGDRCRIEPLGGMGKFYLPITAEDRFAFQAISQTLAGYTRRVEARTTDVAREDRLESELAIVSDVMRETWQRILRASRTDEIVLLRGESGTGKSYIARRIHGLSGRASRPFIEVSLASEIGSDEMIQAELFGSEGRTPAGAGRRRKGLFSLADGGTIFLDEVGDATAELQAKLLRVIEKSTFRRLGGVDDISVDVRVVAATSRDLELMVDEGRLRRDLYYRLNVITIGLPPLRDRPEDIPALVEFLLGRAAAKSRTEPKRLAPGLADVLCAHSWPGNIRELDHALKHASAMAEGAEITRADLPETLRALPEG